MSLAAAVGRWPLALGALLALVLAGCAVDETSVTLPGDGTSATTSPVTTSPVTTGSAANDLAAFERDDLPLLLEDSEVVLRVAVADTPVLRAQGLMGVTDLVDVDGMLFVFDEEVDAAFWMKDTLIPLDIWFFDGDGRYVDSLTMIPCAEDPCPRYPAAAPFRFALETEVGSIDSGARPTLLLAIPRSG